MRGRVTDYTTADARRLLRDYFRVAHGARGQRPEETIGSKPPPSDEGPGLGLIRQMADLELALNRLPFRMAQIIFETEAIGATHWARSCNSFEWRRKVADLWGITPGDVNNTVGEAYRALVWNMNGGSARETNP